MITLRGKISVQRLRGMVNITAAEGGGGPLQEKRVYPTHDRQVVASDEEFYGLSVVTIEPVPRKPYAEDSVIVGSTPTKAQFVENVNLRIETVVLDEHIVTHCYYNGVKLPVIPEDVLAEYPYAWIRNNTTSGYYDLFLSPEPFYLVDADSMSGSGITKPWYQVEIATAESATEWTYYKDSTSNLGIDSARTVLWSNRDIPNGSADATEIYFEGTDPVPI